MLERYYVSEPSIFLTGCQPWPPVRLDTAGCPVCGGAIREQDVTTHCGWCDRSHPVIEARVKRARLGIVARTMAEVKERTARQQLKRKGWPILSEVERRRVWNGYRHSVIHEYVGALTNVAAEGREFLTRIGQTPNWGLTVDRMGRTIRAVA